MNEVFYLLLPLGILLVFTSALLSMASASFSALTETMKQIAQKKDRVLAQQLEEWMCSRREVLSAINIADGLVTLPLIFFCLWWVDAQGLSVYLPGWMLAMLLFVAVTLLCELLPKLVGLAQPVFVLSICWPIVSGVYWLLGPIVLRVLTWNDLWMDRSSDNLISPDGTLSLEELQSLLEVTEEEGGVYHEEAELLQKIIKLSSEVANHCMIPRVDTFTLPDNLSNAQAVVLIRWNRHRQVPIRGETPDEILGVLDARDFLLFPERHYTGMLKPPSLVPETIQALDLLVAFQIQQKNMAILLDEYGGIEGLVTFSDLLEEIFGEDGHEHRNSPSIKRIEGGRFLASGGLHLDELGEVLGIDTSDFSAHTVGGLLIEHFGQLPKVGASMLLANWEVCVRQISRKRVLEVLISPLQQTQTSSAASLPLLK
ncbi:Magnesium and cobalt efflux protein CorC [Candidatus Xiphinematobacter sp. Idaho Grape]|uniref:hemolysin family protein n=1 Tax=Candidatus Xiphinematobacter sp. Idaho Grape TaxID=1704307 RepID=UPI00070616F3|nr:transporter associated domain-containing protein [Candidatus Xiphinematobacter sp. Idaho Grape]ALJ56436.1 Magnesium and cobalt efflux protein CorC [Candidatus Xiphinematobacter sp. Idaho Grape]